MARKVDPIKECIQFRGTPDPIRGDELNKRVRDAAREALDAIFDSQMPVTTSAVAAANRIQGMGNDYVPDAKPKESSGIISSLVSGIQNTILKDNNESSYVGNHGATGSFQTSSSRYNGPSASGYDSGKYSGSSSSGMTGIGNPNYRDARDQKSWMQKASEAAQAIAGSAIAASSSASGGPTSFSSSGTSDYSYATNRGANAYGMNDPGYNPRPMNAFGSNSAGNWQNGGFAAGSTASGGFSSTTTGTYVGRAGAAVTDGTYEKSIIDSLCEPGGLKPVPPEDKLQQFLATAPTLSADIVGNCLADNLQSDQWQTRTKALLVIAALMKTASCQTHVDWWLENAEEVRVLLQDSKANVRTQTVKTLKAIGVEVSAPTSQLSAGIDSSPKPFSNQGITIGAGGSLLEDFDEPAAVSLSAAPVQPMVSSPMTVTTAVPQNGGGLFGDLQLSTNDTPQSAAPSSMSSIFDGLAIGQSNVSVNYHVEPMSAGASPMMHSSSMNYTSSPAPAPASTSSHFDFLEGMTVSSCGNNQSVTPTLPPQPVSNFSVFDALDNTPLLNAQPAPVANAMPVASYTAPTNSAGDASSGFSFFSSTVPANPADVISSAFVQNAGAEKNKEDSFAALSASYGLTPSSSTKATTAASSVPLNGGMAAAGARPMYPSPAGGMMYGGLPAGGNIPGAPMGNGGYGMNAGGMGMMMPGATYNPNVSPLAPSMLAHNAPRKNIPDAATAGVGSSGFSFMGTGGPVVGNSPAGGARPANNNSNSNDSFDFVSQAMRGMN
jgi:hypothetical protein